MSIKLFDSLGELLKMENILVKQLLKDRLNHKYNSLYSDLQITMAYHSNKIEGSHLSIEETTHLFNTTPISTNSNILNDTRETMNHFRALDMVLDTWQSPLSEDYIKGIHGILKVKTIDETQYGYAIGEYKKYNNRIGNAKTTEVANVKDEMTDLIYNYKNVKHDLQALARFHAKFECIHPFQDGNGRVGRLILFKECLANDILPVLITTENKLQYTASLYAYQQGIDENANGLTNFLQTAQKVFLALCKKHHVSIRGGR